MRRILMTAVAVMLVAGIAAAEGGTCAKSAKGDKGGKGKASTVAGEVVAVDAAAGKLSIKDKDGVVTEFAVTADAKIMKPGKKGATLADVVVGDNVTVMCMEKDGVKAVKHVKVKPAKKPKGDKEKGEKEKPAK